MLRTNNVCGTIAWRCRYHQTMKCKARLTTSGDRVVSSRDPDHNHTGNVSIARALKAVGEMKNKITDLTVTPSSSQAAVMSELPDDSLMAMTRQATVSRALRRHRKKVTDAANGDTPLPAIPKGLLFDIPPESFADIVVFDSDPGDNRLILISCNELLDGLARAPMWLADGTFKVVPSVFFQLYTIHFAFGNGVCPCSSDLLPVK